LGYRLCYCYHLGETNNLVLIYVFLFCLVFNIQKSSLSCLEPRGEFRRCGLRSCNLLDEIHIFGLIYVLISLLVSELQKMFSQGHQPRTLLRFVTFIPVINLLSETSYFCRICILLPSLISKVQKIVPQGHETRTILRGCEHYPCNLLADIKLSISSFPPTVIHGHRERKFW
jgi:hypothetical protein